MGPRAGFTISVLAACGIHAAFLLLPRAAIVSETSIPTVEIDLAEAPSFVGGPPVLTRAVAAKRRVEPVIPLETPPAPAGPAPALPFEDGQAAPLPASDVRGPRAAPAGGNESPPAGNPAGSPGSAASGGTAEASAPAPALLPPRLLAEIQPAYPRSARRSGLEGVVKVAAVVDASGVVRSVEVFASSGHAALDQAALEAIRRAIFAPAFLGDTPVSCRVVIPIRFKLAPP